MTENQEATIGRGDMQDAAYWWSRNVVDLHHLSLRFQMTADRIDAEIMQWRDDLTEGALTATDVCVKALHAAHDTAIEDVRDILGHDVGTEEETERVSNAYATISYVHHIAEGVLGALERVEDIF